MNTNTISTTNRLDNFNYGMGILRPLFAFEVVLCHYWAITTINPSSILNIFYNLRRVAVPVFMVMAFYFLEPKFSYNHQGYLKTRIYRLAIPYIAWAIIYFVAIYLTEHIFSFTFFDGVTFKSLGWQLLLGSCEELCPPLWFQAVLIILTTISFMLRKYLNPEKVLSFFLCLTIISLYLQYSSINFALFGGLEYEQRYTLGRIAEMIPFAFTGLVLARLKPYIENVPKFMIIVGCISIPFFIDKYAIFSDIALSFGYAGFHYLFYAISIVTLAIVFPLPTLPSPIKKIIKFLSEYSFGVYCLHWIVGLYVMHFISGKGLQCNRFGQCIIIWIISYILSFAISKIPIKGIKKLVK